MRAQLTVCGLGPGGTGDLTEATVAAIQSASQCFLRTTRHPTAHRVPNPVTFDRIYDDGASLPEVYRAIAEELVSAALAQEGVVYVVPGSPLVLERSVTHLLEDGRVEVELVPSLSFLDVAWARLGVDPVEAGVRLVDGHVFGREIDGVRGPVLVAHAHAPWVLSDIKLSIDAGPEQKVTVLQGLGTPDERIFELSWPELDRSFEPDHLTSLYLSEIQAPVGLELRRSVELMHRLRQECPWDAEQTHESLRRYLLEETYEVLDALDGLATTQDYTNLEEELGDLWFQILFQAELASEAGAFTIGDVARVVHDKLVARHPHVFAEVEVSSAGDVEQNWEAIKKKEKGRSSVMDGIPESLPALSLATKVVEKAQRSQHRPSIDQLRAAIDAGFVQHAGEVELGQMLLAVVEQATKRGIDTEQALRRATLRARDRYRDSELQGSEPTNWIFG